MDRKVNLRQTVQAKCLAKHIIGVPQHIVVTAKRQDMVYSESERIVYSPQLAIPFEDMIEEDFKRSS